MEGETLPLVTMREELVRNAATLDSYLGQAGGSKESEFVKNLIRKGHCFVVVSSNDGYRFYPSRFMGYAGNSLEIHTRLRDMETPANITIDGKRTDPAITDILGERIKKGDTRWASLNAEYQKFCDKYDIKPDKIEERKFWELSTR